MQIIKNEISFSENNVMKDLCRMSYDPTALEAGWFYGVGDERFFYLFTGIRSVVSALVLIVFSICIVAGFPTTI